MRPKIFAAVCTLLWVFASTSHNDADAASAASAVHYEVLRELPHDTSHFTQGLLVKNGRFLESTGLYGQSALYEKDIESGRVLRTLKLPDTMFGEGIASIDGLIHLLSWRERVGMVFDGRFRLQKKFRYEGEGWGLAASDRALIMSDGSAELRFLDPRTHAVVRRLHVCRDGTAVDRLNELESARGWLLANIWYSDLVMLIAPDSGQVHATLDLAPLRTRMPELGNDPEKVANGIAFDADSNHLYVTGKRWPRVFELRVDWPDEPTGAPQQSPAICR